MNFIRILLGSYMLFLWILASFQAEIPREAEFEWRSTAPAQSALVPGSRAHEDVDFGTAHPALGRSYRPFHLKKV